MLFTYPVVNPSKFDYRVYLPNAFPKIRDLLQSDMPYVPIKCHFRHKTKKTSWHQSVCK